MKKTKKKSVPKSGKTEVSPVDSAKFFIPGWDAVIMRQTVDRADKLNCPWVRDILVQCQALKLLALHNPTANEDGGALAAQLLYEIALWSIRCLDQIQNEKTELLKSFAPKTDVWPVLFRKKVQVKQTILPRLEEIDFAKEVVVGKGNMLIDEQNPAAMRVMELITVIEFLRAGYGKDIEGLFASLPDEEFLLACQSLPENPQDGAEAWWAILVRLLSFVFGDLGALPPSHPLVKLIPAVSVNDPRKLPGTGRPGTQRGRINDALRRAFESLVHRKLRTKTT